MPDFFKAIILNPLVYALLLFLLFVIYITRIITEQLPKNIIKAEYAASGLTKSRVRNIRAIAETLELTDSQKQWINNVVIDEIISTIDLAMVSRKKALTLLFIFRALPLFTSLLTALAAQVREIQTVSLFLVNVFTTAGAIANETNRLSRHYPNWVFARGTANDLYSATIKFIAVSDHPLEFPSFVDEIERLQNRYDRTIDGLLSADLDVNPQEKDKSKLDRAAEKQPVEFGLATTVATAVTGAVASAVIAAEVANTEVTPDIIEPDMPEGF